MALFRWRTASNSTSKTSERDRRREMRARRARFRPWAEMLEGRVVLSTDTMTALNLNDLAKDIATANSTALPQGTTDVVIDLVPGFRNIGTYSVSDFNPSPAFAGLNLSIVNTTDGPASITVPFGSRFLTVAPSAGAVTINGGATGITLVNSNSVVPGNGGAIDYEGDQPTRLPYSLEVLNVSFSAFSATGNGGAIYIGTPAGASPPGPVMIDSCTFGSATTAGDTAGVDRSAIYDDNSASLTISNSTFLGDDGGSKVAAIGVGPDCGPVSVSNCSFSSSGSDSLGGAINAMSPLDVTSSVDIDIDNVSFYQAPASGYFGASPADQSVGHGGNAVGDATENEGYAVADSSFTSNRAHGGGSRARGIEMIGGTGGNASGGAIDHQSTLALRIASGVAFASTGAHGGVRGKAGRGTNNGGNGREADGGAVEVDSGFLSIFQTSTSDSIGATFTSSAAKRGGRGSAALSGSAGSGGSGDDGALRNRSTYGTSITISAFLMSAPTGGGGRGTPTAKGSAGGDGVQNGGADAVLATSYVTFTSSVAQGEHSGTTARGPLNGDRGGVSNVSGDVTANHVTFTSDNAIKSPSGAAGKGAGGATETYLRSFALTNTSGNGKYAAAPELTTDIPSSAANMGIYDLTGLPDLSTGSAE